MVHNDIRDALEYAAGILEQNDAGGTLPGRLRQIADDVNDLLIACEAFVSLAEKNFADWESETIALEAARLAALPAIAAARGETR